MPRPSFALSILFLPFAFHSIQAQGAAQPAETKPGTATVSGRVTMQGEPARGVMVILRHPFPPNSPRATTDENGRFRFTGVAAGRYWISALAPGYTSPNFPDTGGKMLDISEGDKLDNFDLELKRGGVISGRITDSQGRPVIEEIISLSKRDRNNQPQNYSAYSANFDLYRTDDRGVYRIYGLPEGRYLVSVGYAQTLGADRITGRPTFYQRVFYSNATSESEAKLVEVSEGSEATGTDITVSDSKETRDVSGRVVDAVTGQPVADVDVVVQGISSDGTPMGVSYGDRSPAGSDGAFSMFGLAPGKYRLMLSANESKGYFSDPVNVDISESDATGIDIKARKGAASISGVVIIEGTDDPSVLANLSQATVFAYIYLADASLPSPLRAGPFEVKADGSFRISGLQPGKVRLDIGLPKVHLPIARYERNGASGQEEIEIDAGEQVTGVRVVLLYGALTLSGKLKVVGGSLPDGYRFQAWARRTDQNALYSQGATIDGRGQFVIEHLAPGAYEISMFAVPLQSVTQLSPEIRQRLSSVKEKVVVVSDNQQPVTIVIDLTRKDADK